jgi:hypothetical protein
MTVEHRDHRELKINPEGPDDGAPPRTFRLDVFTARQRRDGHQKMWLDETPRERAVLAEGITRRELSGFIAEAADWLAWDGNNG